MLQISVVVRSFPSEPQATGDPSCDFAAIGIGSIVAGAFGAFPVDASPPRTAVVGGAGGRSQLSGLVAVAALIAIVAFFSRFTTYVPQAALAGVLIFIGSRLFRFSEMVRIARNSRWEIDLVIAGALFVIILPIQTGMLLAIMLSLAHGVTLVMWPPSTQLFRVPESTVWWPPSAHRRTVDEPGIVVFAPAAPVNFTNAEYVRRKLFDIIARAPVTVEMLVIEASGMTDIDYTGARMLKETIASLRSRHVEVALARLSDPNALRAAERSGILALLGEERVFFSVQDALDARSTQAPTIAPERRKT